MTKNDSLELVQKLVETKSLSHDEAKTLFRGVVNGQLNDIQLAAAISAIKVRGETASELAGAAEALVESATSFDQPNYPFADVVGTGGDGHNTINLSTLAALTAAACGIKIIKHGNRSITSCSGSFDLLEHLGVNINMSPAQSRSLVDELGICFLFAPNYHTGLRHAAVVRKTLKVRTIFNLLGPLVNPSRPPAMLLGVAKPDLLDPMSQVLKRMGCDRALVVHGSGVDEIAVHGPTSVYEIHDGAIDSFEVSPDDCGTKTFSLSELTCHTAEESHGRSTAALRGQGTDAENAAVCVNVAMVMKLFGHADLKANFVQAMDVLKSGEPMDLVNRMVEASQ